LREQDAESAWLDPDRSEDSDAMPRILGSSFSYRVAVGPQQGRKAFMIRTIRPLERPEPGLGRLAKANGFSLHAGVSCEGHQKKKRERLCRYIARSAVAVPRLSLSSTGKVDYTLKTPYRDGTTPVAFDRGGHPPMDFVARLAALVPKPRVNGTGAPSPDTTASSRLRDPPQPPLAWAGHTRQARPARRGRQDAEKASSRPPTQKYAHPPSVMPPWTRRPHLGAGAW
jgi:hypothetical protein